MAPRLTKLTIQGFKSLSDVTLSLDGLSVLIGDNGSGKSSILEVLEILRRTTEPDFAGKLASAHGGMIQLLEAGADRLEIVAEIDDGNTAPLRYKQVWSANDPLPAEYLVRSPATRGIWKKGTAGSLTEHVPQAHDSLIYSGATQHPEIRKVSELFGKIEVHHPFQVTAQWAAASERNNPRTVSLVEPTSRLRRFGTNLVNTYQSLKNDFGVDHWNETLEYVQLGLGDEIRDVRLEAIPGGGHIALALETRHQGRVPAFSLSDGMLSYLAFVAMFRLGEGRTLLAFDEPEVHLHPALLQRVLGMFEAMAERHPVVIATHSDRLLDGLSDPAGAVVVTELDPRRRTRLRQLDKVQLEQWIGDYRGLGELRADGELSSVLAEPTQAAATPRPTPPPQ